MGDISEIRGLVTVGTFITICCILIGLIPATFFSYAGEERQISVDPYFEVFELQNFNTTYSFTMAMAPTVQSGETGFVDFGGRITRQMWYDDHTWIDLYNVIWILPPNGIFWYDQSSVFLKDGYEIGKYLYGSRLNSDYADEGIKGLSYIVEFGATRQMNIMFSFNETSYDTPYEAWQNSELRVMWGMNFDQMQSTFNAWNIIAMILFYNLPDVHWFVNLLLKIPIWISIAYLSFILLLRAIGAIFGGGA